MSTIKKYNIHLKSLSPFIMHKDTLADPLHPLKKQMSQITSIKKKTDEHHLAIARLEWEAGLYYDEEIGMYISSKMMMGAIKAAARSEKKGKDTKCITIDCALGIPIIGYEKITPDELWKIVNKKGEQVHVFTENVTVQRAKVKRTRPIFPKWEVSFDVYLNTEIMEERDFKTILERAGLYMGIGECRPQLVTGTYGRFTIENMKLIK